MTQLVSWLCVVNLEGFVWEGGSWCIGYRDAEQETSVDRLWLIFPKNNYLNTVPPLLCQ